MSELQFYQNEDGTIKAEMLETMRVKAVTNFDRLMAGELITARAQLADAQATIAVYPKVVSSLNEVIDKIVHDGFALMYSINNSITYDNEEEARKGGYGLPVHVVEEMHKFTQLLHDHYDAKPEQ